MAVLEAGYAQVIAFYCVLGFGASVFALWLPVLYDSRKDDRHARCLRNIARLEHELGIAEDRDHPFTFRPAYRYLVTDPSRVQQYQPVSNAKLMEKIASLQFYGVK